MYGLERGFLRKAGWWLLPALGAVAGVLWGTHGWHAVALDPQLAAPLGRGVPWGPAGAGAVAGFAVYLLWNAGLAAQRARGVGRLTFTLPLALACALVPLAEFALRQPQAQNPFWLSVRARLRPGYADYFIRELTYWRLDVLGPSAKAPNALVVAGSSQVLHGFDFGRLSELTGRPVKRRALAGMDPVKLCGAQDWLQARAGDTLVLYISEFDLSGGDRLDLNWMRPLSSPSGVRDVIAAMPRDALLSQWRQAADLAWSSLAELWRIRDYASHLLFHPFGPIGSGETDAKSALREQERVYAEGTARESINTSRLRALENMVRRLRARGVEVVIFEGQVNPAMRNPNGERLRLQTREALVAMAPDVGFTYVPASEQRVSIGADDWLDGTHMNAEGRRKFTEYAASVLRKN